MNRKRILIADDEEVIRMIIRMALGEEHYGISEATDGEEAWQKIITAIPAFDLVMLDLNMPRLGGKELLQRILARDPTARVILLTGTPYFLDAPQPLVQVMNKPFDSSALARAVADLLAEPQP
jgi:CheY-like chemotaxis protein